MLDFLKDSNPAVDLLKRDHATVCGIVPEHRFHHVAARL